MFRTSRSQNNWTQNYYFSLKKKKKNENCRNVADMMLLSSISFDACDSHLNCLRFAGKISVSEFNCKCGRQKYKLKLLWPVATKKRGKNRCDDCRAGFTISCSNSFFGTCLSELHIKCFIVWQAHLKVMASSIGESKKNARESE